MKDTEFGNRAYRRKFSFRKKMIFIPFVVAGILFLLSYIVMQLWNALMPVIFHLAVISFWQAMGLLILAKILFGFGGPGKRGGGAPWMGHRLRERFKNMSPEEQLRFREQMRERCGKWSGHHDHHDWWDKPAENPAKPADDTAKPTE